MIEIEDAAGRDLLCRLLAFCPDWEDGLEAGGTFEEASAVVYPRLHIPSAHPTIRTPLTITLAGTLPLDWHVGYFFDFIGEDPADDAFEFLRRFFAEEVRYGVCWRGGRAVAGGPVEGDGVPLWRGEYDRIEVRSWRGNRDEGVECGASSLPNPI